MKIQFCTIVSSRPNINYSHTFRHDNAAFKEKGQGHQCNSFSPVLMIYRENTTSKLDEIIERDTVHTMSMSIKNPLMNQGFQMAHNASRDQHIEHQLD